MIVVGITGAIGMGKSTVAAFFKENNIPVFDVDTTIHGLYEEEIVKAFIKRHFPDCLCGTQVVRKKLGAQVFKDPAALKKLETFLYPLLHEKEKAFLEQARQKKEHCVVFDMPLLFEKKRQGLFDKIIVVDAPFAVQKARVLARPGMSVEKFLEILKAQLPNSEKVKEADVVVNTALPWEETKKTLENFLKTLKERRSYA